MSASLLLIASTILACSKPDYQLNTFAPIELELEVTSPTYGLFLGEESAVVTGWVSTPAATVLVEGEVVQAADDGTFSVTLPMDGLDYRMIDIEASIGSLYERERIPVFSGHNPIETWPSAATARLTTAGLDKLGESLGAVVDGLGWDTMIMDAIPSVDTDYFDMYATEVAHAPTVVFLEPDDLGINAQVLMDDVSLEIEVNALDGLIVVPISVGFDHVTIDAFVEPHLGSDGMLSLEVASASIDMGDAEFEFGGLDGYLLELVVDAIAGFIEPLGDVLLDVLLAEYGVIELGGPLSFETDLMGTSLAANLSSLVTDVEGMGAGLGIGINAPAPTGAPAIPTPGLDDGLAGAHATIAVHEALFQLLLSDSLVGLLAEFDLTGTYGDLLGGFITALPGGEQAPSGSWCIDLDPGTAMVVRMKESVLPVAQLHMPDFRLKAGNGASCEPWLDTSLELTLNLGFTDGAALDLDVVVPDGAVVYYGAEVGTWEEDAVVAGMGDMMGTLIGLAGNFIDLDLGSLLGGLGGEEGDPLTAALGDLDLQVQDSRRLYNEDGSWTEGLYVLSLQLWGEE